VVEGGSGAAPVGSVGGVGRRRPLRPGCQRDGGAGGARRGVGRCYRSLGRGVRACTTSWTARGGVHLGGGGNHGGARQGRLGKDTRDGRRCLNRPGSRGHDVGGEMPPCYGAPRRARTDRTADRSAVRRVHGARTTRRRGGAWRAGSDALRGTGRPGKGARLGWRATSVGSGLGRGRQGGAGGATSRRIARPTRVCFAESLFEHK
jgi:hypothetical protein